VSVGSETLSDTSAALVATVDRSASGGTGLSRPFAPLAVAVAVTSDGAASRAGTAVTATGVGRSAAGTGAVAKASTPPAVTATVSAGGSVDLVGPSATLEAAADVTGDGVFTVVLPGSTVFGVTITLTAGGSTGTSGGTTVVELDGGADDVTVGVTMSGDINLSTSVPSTELSVSGTTFADGTVVWEQSSINLAISAGRTVAGGGAADADLPVIVTTTAGGFHIGTGTGTSTELSVSATTYAGGIGSGTPAPGVPTGWSTTITTSCPGSRAVRLRRFDRDYIAWPISGMQVNAAAYVELEGDGQWHPLVSGPGEVLGYFAGPDHPSPAPAVVVPTTSHCEIRVITGGVTQVTLDGGMIAVTR
jgi:hypothetical protein